MARHAEHWARSYIETASLEHKLAPGVPPADWSGALASCPERPGRPPELDVQERVRAHRGSFRSARARARLLHTFFHHELQAAELMCWAALRFADAPLAFRNGLLRICLDEVRHMTLYRDHIETLGFSIGSFPVRDWFWERIPRCASPLAFVATMGMGFEGANLEHSARFAKLFREAGDARGAEIQTQVGREEVAHVRFAVRWFRHWAGAVSFSGWEAHLPPPLSPMLMRGSPIHHEARAKAGLDASFCESLERWQP